jgi:hypothetical protein
MGAGGEQTIWKRHRVCVGEGCESERERERELATERERGREGAFVSINGV